MRKLKAYSAATTAPLSDAGVRQLVAAYRGRNGAVLADWTFKPGFIYTQTRAITARINQNYDGWPSSELKKSYRSFLGKPCFVNHQNFDPSLARGKVVAARYREAGDDKFIEVIQEIDAQRFPKLGNEIKSGGMDSVSMGVEAGFTICSYCGNKAVDVPEFCEHVRYHKGEKLSRINKKTGKRESVLVYEKCYKLGFFELSYVFDPADETALVSRVIAAAREPGDGTISPEQVDEVRGWMTQRHTHGGDALGEVQEITGKPIRYYEQLDSEDHANIKRHLFGVKDPVTQKPIKKPEKRTYAPLDNFFSEQLQAGSMPTGTVSSGVLPTASRRTALECSPSDPNCQPQAALPGSEFTGKPQGVPLAGGGGSGSSLGATPASPASPASPVTPGAATPASPLKPGPTHDDGGDTGGGLRPETQGTLTWLNKTYPQFNDIGGYRKPDGFNEHSSGSALDVMLPKGYDTSQSQSFIKDVFKNSPSADYILYDNHQWNRDGTSSTGISSPHTDHFHIHHATRHAALTPDDYTEVALIKSAIFGIDIPGLVQSVGGAVSSATQMGTGAGSNGAGSPGAAIPGGMGGPKPPDLSMGSPMTPLPGDGGPSGAASSYARPKPVSLMTDLSGGGGGSGGGSGGSGGGGGQGATPATPAGAPVTTPGGGVPLTKKPDGTYTSPDPAWAHLIDRESGGRNIIQSPSTQDRNSGGNEAFGLFQITPGTWSSHGGQGSVYDSTPEQQAGVAAEIIRKNPSGSDWGAGLSGRENAQALSRGLAPAQPTRTSDRKEIAMIKNQMHRNSTGEDMAGATASGSAPVSQVAYDDLPQDEKFFSGVTGRRHRGYGEVTAPEDVDTLRDESEDHADEFKHYVESPQELQGPNLDQTKRLDREQEQEGLDVNRRAEDVEDIGGAPMPISARRARRRRQAKPFVDWRDAIDQNRPLSPEEYKAMKNQHRDQPPILTDPRTGRRYYAAEEESDDALIDEAEKDLESAKGGGGGESSGGPPPNFGGSDDSDDDDSDDDSDSDEDDDDDSDDDSEDDSDSDDDDGGSDKPPWLNGKESRRSGNQRSSTQKKRRARKGTPMSLAQRHQMVAARQPRQHYAGDTSGHFDGGPYGENNQGEQEEVYLSQTPSTEGVADPVPGDGTISNSENSLVASLQKRIMTRNAEQRRDLIAWEQVTGQRLGGAVETADTVNPELSGTGDQSLKGNDFEAVTLDDTVTSPKDASVHAFRALDNWLYQTTGRTARQHGDPTFIRRAAARFCQASGMSVEAMFPALGIVLREARNNGGAMRREADDKLEIAAPQDRIDVEKPVSDTTDADAQASQPNLNDFGGNASDSLADPNMSSDSQIWAPGEGDSSGFKSKESTRKTDGITAVRYAEAYIRAGLAPNTPEQKWEIAGLAQTMRHGTIVDRTRLLDAVNQSHASTTRRTAGVSRGNGSRSLPSGLGQRQLTAGTTHEAAANDQSTDSALFFRG